MDRRALVWATLVVLALLLVASFAASRLGRWEAFAFAGAGPYAGATPCDDPDGVCSPGDTCCPAGAVCGAGGVCLASCADAPCPAGFDCVGGRCAPQGQRPVPSWRAPGRDASFLRFRRVTFAVAAPDGRRWTKDVTANLNAAARGFRRGGPPPPRRLFLDRPLNAFSFVIAGFNDAASVPTAAAAAALGGLPAVLSGEWRAL